MSNNSCLDSLSAFASNRKHFSSSEVRFGASVCCGLPASGAGIVGSAAGWAGVRLGVGMALLYPFDTYDTLYTVTLSIEKVSRILSVSWLKLKRSRWFT